jgi:hypothetical protein
MAPAYPTSPYPPVIASPVNAPNPEPEPQPRRGASYYILLSVAALALFAASMFVTILLLR